MRPEAPPGLLLDPEMRRALAEWNWSTALRMLARGTGASQTAIATATGLSQPHVSRLMNGKSREPGIGTVRALCDGLAIPRVLAGLASTIPEDEEAATRAGDAGSAYRALNEADNTFDPRPDADDPCWISFLDEAELAGLKAASYSYLRRHDRAVSLLEQAVRRQTGDELRRNHAWFRVALAEQRLMQRDLTGACETVADALPVFSEITSTRTRRRLGRVCADLARLPHGRARDVVDQARRLGVVAA